MEKFILTDDMFQHPMKVGGESSNLYRLQNGSVLKVFKDSFLKDASRAGINLEKKILNSEYIASPYRVNLPIGAGYDQNGYFKAYTTNYVEGQNLHSFSRGLSYDERCSLDMFALIHYNLESMVRKNQTIVFPDFCTRENFIIDSSLNVTAIDYDGLQVGNNRNLCFSSLLGDFDQYLNIKYMSEFCVFTKELDKKSLIYMYFLNTFNISLALIDKEPTLNDKAILLSKLFDHIGLDDYDVIDKVWKIYQNDQCNEYLGNDVFRLADKYRMECSYQPVTSDGAYLKRLVRK